MKNNFSYLLVAFLLGLSLIIAGFIYALFFAGIPFQDPTPAQSRNYDFHHKISNIVVSLGLFLFISSLALKAIKALIGLRNKG